MQSGMNRRTALGALAGGVGMVTGRRASAGIVFLEKTEYKGWRNAYRLRNATIEVVVVPSVGGRILRYGFTGGPNMLWENPTVAGKPISLTTWPNTGGDKSWPWDQADWPNLIGHDWPPPPAADPAPYQAEILNGDTLRLTSSLVSPWGIRIVRDIRVDRTGTGVFVTTRFTRVVPGESVNCAVWVVTQIPPTPFVLARLTQSVRGVLDGPLGGGFKPLGNDNRLTANFKNVARIANGALLIERDATKSAKLGTDADAFASVHGDTLFTIRQASTAPGDNAGAEYRSGERAQVYNQPDDAEAAKQGITAYVELEMTSPRKTIKAGETLTLAQEWRLSRLSAADRTPERVAALLESV